MTEKKEIEIPTKEEIEEEISRENRKKARLNSTKKILIFLLIALAIAIILSNFLFPVFMIYGDSMKPILEMGDYVVAYKSDECEQGDMIAFYYNNKVLVKRVIAKSGQWVDIDKYGNVYVDDNYLDEPYLSSKSFEKSNINYPYQVPENSYFVMGDKRENSLDSRVREMGPVFKDQVVGKIFFRAYPFFRIGFIK